MGIVPWHQVGSFEGVAEFVQPFVYGSSGFTEVHQKFFADRTDAVEAGFSGDFSELFFRRSKGYPWGPRKEAPSGS